MNKREQNFYMILVLILTISPLAIAVSSIDISGLKGESYSLGEDVNFKIILLEDEILIEELVDIKIFDALKRREIIKELTSNIDQTIPIENNFPSGIWTIEATYNTDTTISRTFTIKENSEVEFIIEEDNLIIKNRGNTRYTKTIQITIGNIVNSYAQNIGVGKEKTLKLISPEGTYDIKISDGETTIERKNIQLYGTGNVIGAVDSDLVGYTGFANVGDPENVENTSSSLKKIPTTIIFIAAVFGLAILVTIERRLYKKRDNAEVSYEELNRV